ncbi:MAG: amphi-Trp domain-containing protein [Methanotrichaceae archaeon]|nr:amphi-Trp domain-containing protein [Methanotrichaceae archaeon]
MVTIPGTTGKVKGTPGAEGKFECEVLMKSNELALFLIELAAEVDSRGMVELSREGWTLGTTPSEPLKIEVQQKNIPGKMELQVQIKLKESP